jgi:GNAT superfamily N-acetyltransferase
MVDMLVKLYDLPTSPAGPPAGVTVRRALAAEKHVVCEWVSQTFGRGWADECEAAFCRQPVSCFMATAVNRPVGFCVYDSTARGIAGPIGVAGEWRGRGLGRALLLAALNDMRAVGYAYGVIGWVDATEFFARSCGAGVIEGSQPGLYLGILKRRLST